MKAETLLLLLACSGFISVVASQANYCGRRLADALDFLCEGNLIKRSEHHHKSLDMTWPWIEPSAAHSMGHRKKRQVVAECCDKPCTISELLEYCHY